MQAASSLDLRTSSHITESTSTAVLETPSSPTAVQFIADPMCTNSGDFSNLIDLDNSIPRHKKTATTAAPQSAAMTSLLDDIEHPVIQFSALPAADFVPAVQSTAPISFGSFATAIASSNTAVLAAPNEPSSSLNAHATAFIPKAAELLFGDRVQLLRTSSSMDNYKKLGQDSSYTESRLLQSLLLANSPVVDASSLHDYKFDEIKARLERDYVSLDDHFDKLFPPVKIKARRPTGRAKRSYAKVPLRRSKRLQA